MPKVNEETGQPMSDDPEGPDETRGGMERGDPALEGATANGSQSAVNRPHEGADDSSTQLPAEQGSDK